MPRWPAEWEPHQAIWLAWPHNAEDWPDRFGPIPWVYADFISKLSRYEHVNLIVNETTQPQAVKLLQRYGVDGGKITFIQHATDRVWTRDFCPSWVAEAGRKRAVKWRFNAWAKYDNWQNDDGAGKVIAGPESVCPIHEGQGVVLEGGSIDGNGTGTLLTTEECLLSAIQCRNPGFTKPDYETIFQKYLGIRKTVWLKQGIVGDDTHGHVDDLARFIREQLVVCVYESDRGDDNHESTRENLEILRRATDADGKALEVIALPMPAPIVFDGQRLPASYANFLIANRSVFVPTFNDPNDKDTLRILSSVFPDREIIGIYCGDLIWGLGTLHCMSMQEPLIS
jgi:agmatine deiminase